MAKTNGQVKINVAVLQNDVKNMSGHMSRLADSMERLEQRFETLEAGRITAIETKMAVDSADVGLLKKIVYGMIAIILTSVIVAIVALVVG